ncbi:hypothetical protein B296_00022899 [Ensete ventricosum]|uniref:Uncharacterized protein n=1 Tax=Ensete ventricosum TaxID=4639 RepID=A0A426ZGV6_ENSVE|nr:hypothetical protein B296_00022899 [Ensete ventricosum]
MHGTVIGNRIAFAIRLSSRCPSSTTHNIAFLIRRLISLRLQGILNLGVALPHSRQPRVIDQQHSSGRGGEPHLCARS